MLTYEKKNTICNFKLIPYLNKFRSLYLHSRYEASKSRNKKRSNVPLLSTSDYVCVCTNRNTVVPTEDARVCRAQLSRARARLEQFPNSGDTATIRNVTFFTPFLHSSASSAHLHRMTQPARLVEASSLLRRLLDSLSNRLLEMLFSVFFSRSLSVFSKPLD